MIATVPWVPGMVRPEFPGAVVWMMQDVQRLAEEQPGCAALEIIDRLHLTNVYGCDWEECEKVVELALQLGMVDGVFANYEGVA